MSKYIRIKFRNCPRPTQLGLCVALLLAGSARGQQPQSALVGGTDPDLPQPATKTDALAPAPQFTTQDSVEVKDRRFGVPDIPNHWTSWSNYEGRYFGLRFGTAMIGDYNAFWQDLNSIDQVGRQRDQWDIRSARFIVAGKIGPDSFPLRYMVAYEFKGFDQDPDKRWGFTDLNLAIPAGKLGVLTVGKNKEPFIYEMVGDSAFLPQLERVLSPFFVSRSVGVVINNSVLKKRMTYGAGWFNDWWVQGKDFSSWGNQFAARVTGLISINQDGSRYFHVGGGARYAGANEGFLRLRGKPESNVTDYYVDTLNIRAANQKELAFETLWDRDSCSVTFEYVHSWLNAAEVANPTFYGLYITGSWIITGEHRPYDRNVGFARRVIPDRHWGAVELVARYSRIDLSNKAIDGGLMDIGHFGVNWFLNRRWKIGASTGIISLDRFGSSGLTNSVEARLQFIY